MKNGLNLSKEMLVLQEKISQEENQSEKQKLKYQLAGVKERYDREQKKQQQLKEKQQLVKKFNNFSSGSIEWIREENKFYPTWKGICNGQHVFTIQKRLSLFELTITHKGTTATNIEKLGKKAEEILQKLSLIVETKNK